jgi:hypothetical protein
MYVCMIFFLLISYNELKLNELLEKTKKNNKNKRKILFFY